MPGEVLERGGEGKRQATAGFNKFKLSWN